MISIFIQLIFIFLFTRQILIVFLAMWTYVTGDAPFKSTEVSVIKKLVASYQLPTDLTIYDLGSGTGEASFVLARYLPNNFVGLEKNLVLHWFAKFRNLFRLNKNRFDFIHTDLFKFDLSQARLIYLYMSDRANKKLDSKLDNELTRGAIVLALRFKFNSQKFKLIKTIEAKYPLYIYVKK